MNIGIVYSLIAAALLALGGWLGHVVGAASSADDLVECKAEVSRINADKAVAEQNAREEVHRIMSQEVAARDERIARYETAMTDYIRLYNAASGELGALQQRLAEAERRDPDTKKLLDTDISRLRDPERVRQQSAAKLRTDHR